MERWSYDDVVIRMCFLGEQALNMEKGMDEAFYQS